MNLIRIMPAEGSGEQVVSNRRVAYSGRGGFYFDIKAVLSQSTQRSQRKPCFWVYLEKILLCVLE